MPRLNTRVQIRGLRSVMRALRTLPHKQGAVLRSAVSAASTPVLQAMRARIPRESGLAKRSLGRKMLTAKSKQGIVSIVLGARKGYRQTVVMKRGWLAGKQRPEDPRYITHLLEFGVSGHYIPPTAKMHGRFHPGFAPKPFVGPAWNSTKTRAGWILRKKLWEGIAKETAKLAAQQRMGSA